MSFWDTDAAKAATEGGGKYLTAAEKNALIENKIAIQITGVRFDEKNQYQNQPNPRYVATVQVPNGLTGENEERFVGFALNPDGSSRDRLLEALVDYLASDDAEPVFVVMEKIGNFVNLVKADV